MISVRTTLALFSAVLLACMAPTSGSTQTVQPMKVTTDEAAGVQYAGELNIPVNKSRIVRVDASFSNLFVANPDIADVRPLTDRTIYILGKKIGSTSLSIYAQKKPDTPLAVIDLNVTHDIQEIKRQLYELTGGEQIEVRSVKDSLILSGKVTSANTVDRAISVAERYAPDKVTNLMTVQGSQQVMLAVRFAEMKRKTAKDLGVNLDFQATPGAGTISFLSGTGIPATAFGAFGGGVATSLLTLNAMIDALEEKGVVKTLAEPNLIALSGDTATFLAGGEFPIPVAQRDSGGSLAITIEFKEFGVSLAFTPTVIGKDLISLVVAPEVSAIDPSASIELNNIRIPGLTTRRAKTTVELRDGQSFAIAGLIQSEYTDQVKQFPFLGDVPVIGSLLRSSDFQNEQTELVILVTPYLVKPASPAQLALPTDRFTPPSDYELFYQGQIEGSLSPTRKPGGHVMPGAGHGGGLDGHYGHIIQ